MSTRSRPPLFQYGSIDDLAAFIEPGWWLATADVEAYYHRFPLALLWRFLFGFIWGLAYFFYCVVPFGFGPAPYYTSGWSAECYHWVRHARIPASVYMDDWATGGATREEALDRLRAIKDLLEPCGFLFNATKDGLGQRLEFLGVLFGTIAMTLSFAPEKATILLAVLRAHHSTLSAGSNLPHAEARTIADKLAWYAQVLQAGRLHTRLYIVFGSRLSSPLRARLLFDTAWWIDVLLQWSEARNAPQQFPLLATHTFRTDPHRIHVVVSDASGPDGFGYFFGPISSNTPEFRAFRWDATYFFVNSHSSELTALLHFLERTDVRSCLLLWVSDSQSAVYGVNNGTCRPEEGLAVLARILTLCDSHGIVLIAFWVPRESNRISDYLSHLSHIRRLLRRRRRLCVGTSSLRLLGPHGYPRPCSFHRSSPSPRGGSCWQPGRPPPAREVRRPRPL